MEAVEPNGMRLPSRFSQPGLGAELPLLRWVRGMQIKSWLIDLTQVSIMEQPLEALHQKHPIY